MQNKHNNSNIIMIKIPILTVFYRRNCTRNREKTIENYLIQKCFHKIDVIICETSLFRRKHPIWLPWEIENNPWEVVLLCSDEKVQNKREKIISITQTEKISY